MDQKVPNNKSENAWWRPALLLFFQMSAWIAIPVIMGLFIGKWADDRYGTEPWLFLGITGLAFIISIFGMVRESNRAMRVFDSRGESDHRALPDPDYQKGSKRAMKQLDKEDNKIDTDNKEDEQTHSTH